MVSFYDPFELHEWSITNGFEQCEWSVSMIILSHVNNVFLLTHVNGLFLLFF